MNLVISSDDPKPLLMSTILSIDDKVSIDDRKESKCLTNQYLPIRCIGGYDCAGRKGRADQKGSMEN